MSLELIYNCERGRIKRKEDALVCCVHCCLLTAGLKNIGNGEQVENVSEARGSDMLPAHWNDSGEVYALTYRHEASRAVFLVKALVIDGSMFIQLLRHSDEKMTDVEVSCADYITDCIEDYETAYRSLDTLTSRLRQELIEPVISPVKPVSQPHREPATDPLRAEPSYDSYYSGNMRIDHPDPLSIGRSDLDPLAAGGMGGGGMLFDPLRSGPPPRRGYQPEGGAFGHPGIPRGSVPPGARFDPFGPPDMPPRGPHRSGPDPDHMPMPGFYNDMFM